MCRQAIMKLFRLNAFALRALALELLAVGAVMGQPAHKDFYWKWGELQETMWFLRTEGKDVVVMRSDIPPAKGAIDQVLFIVKYDCPRKLYLRHQRYVNGGLDWTRRDRPKNWEWIPLIDMDKYEFACSWLK